MTLTDVEKKASAHLHLLALHYSLRLGHQRQWSLRAVLLQERLVSRDGSAANTQWRHAGGAARRKRGRRSHLDCMPSCSPFFLLFCCVSLSSCVAFMSLFLVPLSRLSLLLG
jgi:hypothetical protein